MEIRRTKIVGLRFPVWQRPGTTDAVCLQKIFHDREYELELFENPSVIVDAGANAGFASVWFANVFPMATIFAIEPERSNFTLLRRNARPYPNIIPIHAALWNVDEFLDVVDPGDGLWAFRTQALGESNVAIEQVAGVTIHRLMLGY